MYLIDTLHESMDDSLRRLAELPSAGRTLAARAAISSIESDLAVERRLLDALGIRVAGLSGVDPLSALLQAEMNRLLGQLQEPDATDELRWDATLSELRLQLEAVFVAVDGALADRA